MRDKKLFEEFPPVTTKEWLDKISHDLKGADFTKKLVWKTKEGIELLPFYRQEDLEKINLHHDILWRSGNRWLIRQDVHVSDYVEANLKALSLLKSGIESIGFVISDPKTVNEDNFRKLLSDIDPGLLEINFLSEGMAREIVAFVTTIFKNRNYDLSLIRGCIEADPLGRLMTNGTLCIPEEKGFDYLSSLTKDALPLPNFRNLQINGSNFKNSGSDSVTELAFSLSMGVEYLDQMTQRGLSAKDVARKIRFSFGTGPDYFIEIAKLRAARILWSLILKRYLPGEDDLPEMSVHCITTGWNTTVYDPYLNMLRTQTEAMSAILGGTDSLTVMPFDSAFSNPAEFSERIARNQQLILKEEAFFDKVTDPSAGSYYIENITNGIVDNSWKLFLEIEKAGGFLESLKSGTVQDKISGSAEKRITDISRRKEVLVGTNKYPDLNEKIGADMNPLLRNNGKVETGDLTVRPVRPSRGSEQIESVRIAVDKAGRRPEVFLLLTGNHVFAKARAQFTSGFFGCAGYRIIDDETFRTPEDGAKAALEAKADIVVICSSDEEYALVAPVIFRTLEGKSIVVIAGNPESMEELKAAGIRNFISMKSDLCETLKYYNQILGIN